MLWVSTVVRAAFCGISLLQVSAGFADVTAYVSFNEASWMDVNGAASACIDQQLKPVSGVLIAQIHRNDLFLDKGQCADGKFGLICRAVAYDRKSNRCSVPFFMGDSLQTVSPVVALSQFQSHEPSEPLSGAIEAIKRGGRDLAIWGGDGRTGGVLIVESRSALFVIYLGD